MLYPVGTRVRSVSGYEGQVKKLYDDFSAIQYILDRNAEEWESLQQPPLTSTEKSERWYAIAVDTGGLLWAPESRLEPEVTV